MVEKKTKTKKGEKNYPQPDSRVVSFVMFFIFICTI